MKISAAARTENERDPSPDLAARSGLVRILENVLPAH